MGRLAQLLGEARDQALEPLLLQPRQQHVGIGRPLVERLGLGGRRHLVGELHQLLGDADQPRVLLQRLASLGLLDLARALQQRFEVAVFGDQLRGRLDADAGCARHVVGGVTGQRLHVDHLVGRDAELLEHGLWPELLLLDRIHHVDAGPDQLHQVLVGGDDGAGAAGLDRHPGIGRDQVVGFVAFEFADRDVEGLGRFADQRELRDQVLRRLGPVGLVLVVDLVAERRAPGVEDHGDVVDLGIVEELHQHAREAVDGVDRRAVRPRHRRQRMIGAEQVARAVDQVEVLERLAVSLRGSFGFRHVPRFSTAKRAPARRRCVCFPPAVPGISMRPPT